MSCGRPLVHIASVSAVAKGMELDALCLFPLGNLVSIISETQAAWRSPLYSIQLLVSPAEALQRCWADTDAFFARILDWYAHA